MIILFLRHIFWVHGKRMIAFHSALSSFQIATTTHSQYCTQEPGTSSQNGGLLRGDGFNIQFRKVVSKHLRLVYILLASLKHRVLGLGGIGRVEGYLLGNLRGGRQEPRALLTQCLFQRQVFQGCFWGTSSPTASPCSASNV